MSVDLISAIAGILISLAFEFVPGVEGWYGKLSEQYKRLFMVGALFVVVGGAFGFVKSLIIACSIQVSGEIEEARKNIFRHGPCVAIPA